jgi:hypothetical protein
MMKWLDRLMYRRLAQKAALDAAYCRMRQPTAERAPFWRSETDRYLDKAAEYLRKAQ